MKTHKKHTWVMFVWVFALAVMLCMVGCGKKKEADGEDHYYRMGMDLFKEGYYQLIPEGKAEEGRQKLEQAVQALETAISMNDQNAASHYLLARIFVILNKYADAALHYNRLIQLDPENVDAYLFLASAYVQLKKYGEAQAVLIHAKSLTEDVAAVERIESLIQSIREGEKR